MRASRARNATVVVAAASGLVERLGAEEDDLDLLGDLLLAQGVALQAELGGLLLQSVQGALQVLHALMVLGRQGGVEHLVQRGEQVVVQQLGQECLGSQVEERRVPGYGPGPGGRFLEAREQLQELEVVELGPARLLLDAEVLGPATDAQYLPADVYRGAYNLTRVALRRESKVESKLEKPGPKSLRVSLVRLQVKW
jgi:hypothetical protein